MGRKKGIFFILVVVLVDLMLTSPAFAGKKVRFATTEYAPYIGTELPNKGYVYELVMEAFKRVGYEVEIAFYPWARATYLSEIGWTDGLLPVYYDEALHKKFLFSQPFPGGTLGLLKRKSTPITYSVDPLINQTEALRSLSAYTFGVVRGAVNTPEFDTAAFLKKDFATSDLQNLLKLSKGRVDLVVIDKYTAADIMVQKLPHMIGEFEFMNPSLALKPFHLAFSRASEEYEQQKQDFDQGLQEVMRDGTLERILYEHGLSQKPPSSDEGKITIRIGTVDNPDMIIMQRLSQEYETQHPEIELEWKVLDENILRLRLMSDLAISDGKFDIMTIGNETPFWAKRGWLVSLTNIPENYDLDDVLKPVRDGLSYDGILYALPFYAESTMTYYRKDLFKKANIIMPDTPTYNDIEKFAAAIHDPQHGVYGICMRGKPGWGENMAFLSQLIHTFGGRWFDETWTPTLQSPEWHQAITFYTDLVKKYSPPNTSSNGFTENLSLFANGHCGIWIDATVAAGVLFDPKESKVADRLGFAPAPIAVTPKGSHWLWSWALAIPVSSKIPEEALKFITWATSKEYIQRVAEHEGWIAVPPGTRVSTYHNPNYQNAAPFANFVLAAIQSANPNDPTLKPTPYTGIQYIGIPEFPALGTQVGQEIARILEGNVSVDQALREAQRVVLDQMIKSGYIVPKK